jgi:uncharacterized repeat protein (TIGR01451 family)
LRTQAEAALEIRGLPAYRLDVTKTADPVEVGGKVSYRVDVTNQGSLPGNQVEIVAVVPAQMRVVNANGPTRAQIDGQRVVFPPVESLAPKQTVAYTIEVEALQPGDVRFHVELRAATLKDPVIKEESTTIFASGPGSVPPRGTPPAGPPTPPPEPAPGAAPGPAPAPSATPPAGPGTGAAP